MGERVSIDALFDSEYPRLVRALGVAFEPESAADAVQEAFFAASRRWNRVARLEDPAAWVRRVALNRLLNERRDTLRRTEILASVAPSGRDESGEARLDLRRAVERLPERMRLAVCLHYLADLSVSDVAELMDVSVGTVKSNLHDARAKLREQLEEQT
jgi:RNA polymerase sigma-70 factor (ECF subfamily)